jgi:cation-transporting ATPase E
MAAPTIEAQQPVSLQGLTENEVLKRREQGQGNNVNLDTSRSYVDIIRQNVFTFVNMVLFGIGIVLIALGLYTDALLSVGIVVMNVVIGVIQEARAKRMLDQIALLTRPRATVIREGHERVIDPGEIVLGDILAVHPGDQIVVDGVIVSESKIEVDESLLTGEADLIPKHAGDTVLSGSYCVTGSARYEAVKVGAESFANQLTANARTFKINKTPLQTDIDFVIRILVLLSVQIAVLIGFSVLINEVPLTSSAKMAAVIAGLIPNGLFFMISIAYAMGAVRIAGRGALIQQSNAVESMSNVNVLCLDKTGTLTANRIKMDEVYPIQISEADFKRLLGVFVASASSGNRTSDAIIEASPGAKWHAVDEVSFTSALKWSALAFDEADMRGVYVLGAPEMLAPYLLDVDLGGKGDEWTDNGLRVLLFAHQPDVLVLHDAEGKPQLPSGMMPLGLISFSDVLRDEAKETLQRFADTGIQLKIISGDNPHTVAALAKQAGLSRDIKAISGIELAQMDEARFSQVAEETTIFGRITPQQKEQLVNALRSRGNYVAMIGDGVNDVLSLKKADIGIAMQSGSDATRGVADIVLLNDSFAALPPAFLEGQRIINGMQDILRLFLTRVFTMALIILGVAVVGVGFPFSPSNSSLLTLLTVGVPTFALAAWARPAKPRGGLIKSVLHYVIPASFTISILGIVVYSVYYISTVQNVLGVTSLVTSQDIISLETSAGIPLEDLLLMTTGTASKVAQSALTTVMTFCGLLLIIFVEPPTQFWVGGDEYSGDWRPTILVIGMFIAFMVIMAVPQLRTFFDMRPLPLSNFLFLGLAAALWALALRYIWRARVFDRFLNLEFKS